MTSLRRLFMFFTFKLTVLNCTRKKHNSILLPYHGAVTQRCGQVAINKGPTFFSMILRFEIPDLKIHLNECLSDEHVLKFLELDKEFTVINWISANGTTEVYTANAQKPLIIKTQ